MGNSGIDFRPLTRADMSGLAAVFADSFDDDPPFVWALPDAPSRRRRLRRIFHTMLRHESHDGVEVACADGRVVGGALWLPPDHWNESVLRQVAAMPGFLRGFGRRITYGQRLMTASIRVHPRDPHWHLSVVGVAPTAQGRGLGATLIRRGLARCDEQHLPAYLESTKIGNVPLYEHFGFERTGSLALPADAPEMVTMWRPAIAM